MEMDGLLSTFMPLPAVTLTFDPKNQSVSLHNLVKLAPVVTKILYSPGFTVIAC